MAVVQSIGFPTRIVASTGQRFKVYSTPTLLFSFCSAQRWVRSVDLGARGLVTAAVSKSAKGITQMITALVFVGGFVVGVVATVAMFFWWGLRGETTTWEGGYQETVNQETLNQETLNQETWNKEEPQ
jgi:hypothetical protein